MAPLILITRRGTFTRRYIQDLIRLKDEPETARELYDRMLALYPDPSIPDHSGVARTPPRVWRRPDDSRGLNFQAPDLMLSVAYLNGPRIGVEH
jgi:hypothetical protein